MPRTLSLRYIPESVDLISWATIPSLDRAAVATAARRLPLVRAMLLGMKAQIACFHVEKRKQWHYSCTLWRGDPGNGFLIADGTREIAVGTLSEICGSLVPLVQHLASRWPERARPRVIGMATDGHRIIFNAEHPSCKGDAWLMQHLSGRAPSAIIGDDGTAGILEFICPFGREVK